jgi:hypothetical protein
LKSFTWLNRVTLRNPKGRSNREYKAYLNERPYYVYSTEIILEEFLWTVCDFFGGQQVTGRGS